MPAEPIADPLREKIQQRLEFYQDLGIAPFYRDRAGSILTPASSLPSSAATQPQERLLPKSAAKLPPSSSPASTSAVAPLPTHASGPSLFASPAKLGTETLLQIRDDLGECTRCKLHST